MPDRESAEPALSRLNQLDSDDAGAGFSRCCGSTAWTQRMVAGRPFNTRDLLFRASDEVFESLRREDWLEAFGAHPRIGDVDATDHTTAAKWSSEEQASNREAPSGLLDDLAELNRRYRRRFGFTYIVCATGRSTDEMIADLKSRLNNDPADELGVAADHQRQITRIRLAKLLASLESDAS